MDLGISKCVIIGCLNKSNLQPLAITTYIETLNVHYQHELLLLLSQNELYIHLGIQLVLSLKWNIQKHIYGFINFKENASIS